MTMTFLIVFMVMALVVAMMAVGVMAGRKPIAGSCGGIANLGIEKECSICGGDRQKCEEVSRDPQDAGDAGVQRFDPNKR